MKLSKFRDDPDNLEIASTSGDIAWGHLKEWHQARDLEIKITAEQCRSLALDICVEDGGRIIKADDPVDDVAHEVLKRLGFKVTSGSIGFDAIIARL
jgi:hypothetical protein